tara:strand:- start:12375 stop:14600 length:2226 start_codon:yes stop_codon:yes gene_type:complete
MLKNSIENTIREAKRFQNKNDLEGAFEIYNSYLKSYPKNIRIAKMLQDVKKQKLEQDLNEFKELFESDIYHKAEKIGDELNKTHYDKIEFLRLYGTLKAKLNKLNEAKEIFLRLLNIEPNPYMTLNNLGNIFYLENDYDQATYYYKKSLKENKDFAAVRNGLGLIFLHKKDYDKAKETFEEYIKLLPNDEHGYINLGNCLKELESYEEALKYYNKALEINKYNPIIYNNIGTIYGVTKNNNLALESFSKAIEINEDYIEALINRAEILINRDMNDEGLLDLNKAIKLSPDNYRCNYLLGVFHYDTKNYKIAVKYFIKINELVPEKRETLNNVGMCYLHLKEYDKSIKYFDLAINADLNNPVSYNNKGNILMLKSEFDEAEKIFEFALSLDPSNEKTLLNLGNLRQIQSNFAEAIRCYTLSTRLKEDYADAYFNLSLIKLLHADFKSGLELYEWRLHENRESPIFDKEIPKRWNGKDDLKNKTIIILAEQGLGDTIQFARFVKLFNHKTTKVFFKVPDCLKDLISTMCKNISVIGFKDHVGSFDYQIPLLSLPYAFNMTYLRIPPTDKYLSARNDLVKHWKKKLGTNGFKIGIAWQGSDTNADRFRSFKPEEFQILSSLKNIRLISLQKNSKLESLHKQNKINIEDYSKEIDNGKQAFLDTAAIIENLDLVITCDTSIAHLSGALNCPTWIMLGEKHDWRWFLNNDKSIWYPSVKLFRQTELENWKHPFEKVKELLKSDYKL